MLCNNITSVELNWGIRVRLSSSVAFRASPLGALVFWPLVFWPLVFWQGIAQAEENLPVIEVTAPAQTAPADASKASPELVHKTEALDQARRDIYAPTGANSHEMTKQTIENLPAGTATPIDKVLLQAPGVTQDSAASGDLHIRNEHANIQYRINGIYLPPGISGFSRFIDTSFIGSLAVLDGVLPAQYGLHTAGIVDIQSRDGVFDGGGSIGMYGGSFGTLMPSLTYGGTLGTTQYFFSGQLQTNNLGIENPTASAEAIHDRSRQGRFFGYISTILPNDLRVSLITGTSISKYQIPNTPGLPAQFTAYGVSDFNSSLLNENQLERSFFNVLALQKTIGPVDAQLSFFSRYSSLHFTPDPVGDLVFNGVASDVTRTSLMNGVQFDAADHIYTPTLGAHTLRFGFQASAERTQALNGDVVLPLNAAGNPLDAPFPIIDDSTKLGFLGSVYLQDEWKLTDRLILNGGLRFDQMAQYVTANQVSPRISLTYMPFSGTTMHIGYARYFTPPEQALSAPVNVAAFNNTTLQPEVGENSPVRPERSVYVDAGVTQKLVPGLEAGVDVYYKRAQNLLDDGQFGQALVLTAFNYARGYNTGVEFTAKYHYEGLDLYANVAWARQRATQVESNQFLFGADELAFIANNYIYTDHAQVWTASGGGSYTWQGTKISADLIYGSGLRDGFANTGTVPPYVTANLGLSHEFAPPGPGLGPLVARFDVINLFDKIYEIRDGSGIGVFAPQFGARRGLFAGLTQKF
mgnify:CR=1 FL=1